MCLHVYEKNGVCHCDFADRSGEILAKGCENLTREGCEGLVEEVVHVLELLV